MIITRAIHRAFSLIELLVVVAVFVVLLALLVPTLSHVKDEARMAQCQTILRQWGMATQCYLNNFNGHLPHEGVSGQNTLADAWYNLLPPYVNQLPYAQVYTGASVGTNGGYANSSIWYCPAKLLAGTKNSSSNKNSFHYTMNAVLNGATSFRFKDNTYDHPTNNSIAAISQPGATVLFAESDSNVPCDSPNATGLARTRHYGNSLNVLFVDLHVQLMHGTDVPVPTQDALTGLWTSSNPTVIWGPFAH